VRLRHVEPALRRALAGPCACPAGGRVLAAVSGGADSVALLLGLHNLAHEFRLDLHAAHLHHGLRGADADADREFVRALCRRLGVPLADATRDTPALMRRRGLSGQAGLRALRREFLREAARRAGANAIATAHTADDQLETVLMRLLRGTGIAGLGGMRERRGAWIKPMLECTRAGIERDLRRAGQPWREDDSNRDPGYLRNRMRHGVVPAMIAALHPGVGAAAPGTGRRGGAGGGRAPRPTADTPLAARGALALRVSRAAAEVQGAERILRSRARRVLSSHCRIQGGEFALDSERMAAYPSAFQRAVLRCFWTRLAPSDPGLTHLHLAALQRLVGHAGSASLVRLPGGWTARRDRERMVFGRPEKAPGRPGQPGAERHGEFGRFTSHPTVLADTGGRLAGREGARKRRAPVTPSTRKPDRVHSERHD
jgi:tRNA(Ile)-lysidine synthetase-like protein